MKQKQHRWLLLTCTICVFGFIFFHSTTFGLNEEMVGPIHLYSYNYLDNVALNSQPNQADCHDGFFHSQTRPIFGVCADHNRQLPLLFNSYTSTIAYWPLWVLGTYTSISSTIIAQLFPAAFLLLLLLLLARLLSTHCDTTTAVSVMLAMTLFPMATLYSTLYLYEYLPIIVLLGIWNLLDAYNRKPRPQYLILAAILFGYALQQKLTAGLVLPFFTLCYLAIYGIRKASTKLLLTSFVMVFLFPLLFLLIQYLRYLVTGSIGELGLAEEPVSWGHMVILMAQWTLASLPADKIGIEQYIQTIVFLTLVLYSAYITVIFFFKQKGNPFKVLVASSTLCIIVSFFTIYRYHPSSLPSLQFLPFVCLSIGIMLSDFSKWVQTFVSSTKARAVVPFVVVAALLSIVVTQWIHFPNNFTGRIRYPRYADQKAFSKILLEKNIRRPVMLNSFENGVFEFLSKGQIRPIYLTEEQCQTIHPKQWISVLDSMERKRTDFLLSVPPSVVDPVFRCNPNAKAYLEEAINKTGREIIHTEEIEFPNSHRSMQIISIAEKN